MTADRPKREVFSNPFFVVLLAVSVLFVLTVFAYLVSPSVIEAREGDPARGRGLALATWLDRNAPLTLGVEFIVMLTAGTLAIATDPWFSPAARARRRGDG